MEISFLEYHMTIRNTFIFGWLLFLSYSAGAQYYIEDFPSECAYASDRIPLPGHIIRVGFVNYTPYGWSLFFPDRQDSVNLQRVSIAENVGIIGQNPFDDISQFVRMRTPEGMFLIGQIFVGDPNMEPVVTCLSPTRPLRSYNAGYYGADLNWLNRDTFRKWLGWRKYNKTWKWKKWWGSKFADVRRKFKHFNFKDYRRKRPLKIKDRDRNDKFWKKGDGWRKNIDQINRPDDRFKKKDTDWRKDVRDRGDRFKRPDQDWKGGWQHKDKLKKLDPKRVKQGFDRPTRSNDPSDLDQPRNPDRKVPLKRFE